MKKSRTLQKAYSVALCILLLAEPFGSVPQALAEELAETDNLIADEENRWSDSIPEMLTAGEYEEGVVVVGIDLSKGGQGDDPGSVLEAEQLGDSAEPLMTVNADTVPVEAAEESAQDLFSTEYQLYQEMSAEESDEEICITSISRGDMTTEQLLYALAEDDHVLFAEPNYIVQTQPDETQDAAEDPGFVFPEITEGETLTEAADEVIMEEAADEGGPEKADPEEPDAEEAISELPEDTTFDDELSDEVFMDEDFTDGSGI